MRRGRLDRLLEVDPDHARELVLAAIRDNHGNLVHAAKQLGADHWSATKLVHRLALEGELERVRAAVRQRRSVVPGPRHNGRQAKVMEHGVDRVSWRF